MSHKGIHNPFFEITGSGKHKNYPPFSYQRKLYFFAHYWTCSLIVRPIATPTPVGLDVQVALPTKGGRARSLRSTSPLPLLGYWLTPIPALPWRLRSFPQNVWTSIIWNSFHAVRRGTNFLRFVYTTNANGKNIWRFLSWCQFFWHIFY